MLDNTAAREQAVRSAYFRGVAAVGEAFGVASPRRDRGAEVRSDPEIAVDALIAAGWQSPEQAAERERAAEQRGREKAAKAILASRDGQMQYSKYYPNGIHIRHDRVDWANIARGTVGPTT